jgi:hypothetical protein
MAYIYGLFYKDDENDSVCFYIGKGSGRRHKEHLYESRISREASLKNKKIKQLKDEEKKLSSKVLVDGLTDKEAYKLEKRVLQRKEVYDAVTNESVGNKNHIDNDTKKKISNALMENHPLRGVTGEDHPLHGTTISEEQKEQISKSLQGENHHSSKLTEQEAGEVKWLARHGDIEQQKVAKIYGISKQSVTSIKKERNWEHADPRPVSLDT